MILGGKRRYSNPPIMAYNMTRAEEWDWPPTRHRRYPPALYKLRRTSYRTVDVYQPSNRDSSVTKKIADIYWRVMITSIKVLLTIALTIMAFGASWLFWTVITL
jgi:hypothetical protein